MARKALTSALVPIAKRVREKVKRDARGARERGIKPLTEDSTPAVQWYFPCLDWERRVMAGKSLLPPESSLPLFNYARADRAEKIFKKFRLPDVPGQPLLEDAAGEWFVDIVRLCAGGYGADSVQRLRELLLMVSKKNNKTTGAAAVMLVLMLMSPRPRADFTLIGPTQEIAQLAFQQAAGMVGCDTALTDRLHVREHVKRIEDRVTGCKLTIKSFDMQIATGSRPAIVLLDEIHLLTHPDAPRIIGQLRGGQTSIPEGQVLQITTQSDVRPHGYWKSELDKARAIRDGVVRLAGICPVMYEFPKYVVKDERQWKNPDLWHLVNPNMGRSVSRAFLEETFAAAQPAGPSEVRRWVSQHLDIEVSEAGLGDDTWPGALLWDTTGDATVTLDYILASCDVIEVGIDGGGLDDILGLGVLGRHRDTGEWLGWVHGWITETALARRKSIDLLLRDFEKEGDLTICPAGMDLTGLIEVVEKINNKETLDRVGLDPAGIAEEIAAALEEIGIDRESRIIGVPQGWRLASAYKMMERKLDERRMRHAKQHIMDWMVANARIDSRNIVSKMVSGAGKIDCLVALACAARLLSEAPESVGVPDIYVLGIASADTPKETTT